VFGSIIPSVSNLLRRSGFRVKILILVVILVFGWRCWFLYQQAQDRYLMISLYSSVSGPIQLYYDRGYGFNEHDSVVIHITKARQKSWGIVPVPASWSGRPYRHYLFHLTPSVIYAFRLDPVSSGTMYIENMEIVDGLEHHLQPIELQNLQPVKHIKAFNISSDEVTVTAGQEGDPQLHILLDSPLIFDRAHPVLWLPFLGTILMQLVVIVSVLGFIVVAKKILSSEKLISFVQNLSGHLKYLMHGHVIFILITALFLWFYVKFNTHLFPVLFEKFFLCALLILIFRYMLTRGEKDKNINAFTYFVFLYLILVMISVFMNYYALNSLEIEHIDFTSDYFRGEVPLFDKHEALEKLAENTSSDQSISMYLFPVFIMVSIALFRSSTQGAVMLTWIPLLFVPILLESVNQCGGLNFLSDILAYFRKDKFLIRLLLFLNFPLCIYAIIVNRQWWKKTLYFILTVGILWLTREYSGRNATLGILLFIVAVPFIGLWVNFFPKSVWNYLSIGLALLFVLTLIYGFGSAKHQKSMRFIFKKETYNSANALLKGDLIGALGGRAERFHTAWRLIRLAPVSGWGPGAFQKNANRIRFINGDRSNVSHALPNYYMQMAANFGFIGLGVVLVIHIMPLWMIIRVQKQVQNHEDRWAVAIVFITVLIMLLIFNTNPNISLQEVNWIYSVYVGFLVSVSIKYGYKSFHINNWVKGAITILVLILFVAGTYKTTFGFHGYQAIQKDLISRITKGYRPGSIIRIWDNKEMIGDYSVKNHLIKTRANPFRKKYTTNVFSMQATSRTLSVQAPINLFCIRISVSQKSYRNNFYIKLQVFFNDKMVDRLPHVFQMEGEKMLYYHVPDIAKNEVKIKVKVDMWRAMPYHEDDRTEVDQKYMPYHPDYRDFNVTVSVIPFEKTISAT